MLSRQLPVESANRDALVWCRQGKIFLRTGHLFNSSRPQTRQKLIERLFRLEEITSIEIHSRRQTISIFHIGKNGDEASLLQRMASVLTVDEASTGDVVQPFGIWSCQETIRVFRYQDTISSWEVVYRSVGQIGLKYHGLQQKRPHLSRVAQRLEKFVGIEKVTLTRWSPSLEVKFDSQRIDPIQVLGAIHELEQGNLAPFDVVQVGLVPRGLTWGVKILAASSFVLALVGVVLPGIPTVPFVLLTSYFLTRSSPKLSQRLLDSRIFGPTLRDWHEQRGIRRRTKVVALAVMFGVVMTSVLWGNLPVPLLTVVVLFVLIGMLVMIRLPTIEDAFPSGATELSNMAGDNRGEVTLQGSLA